MSFFYTVKHVFRSWKLFLALLLGIALASTFFAGVDIKASATAKEALDQDLERVYSDMVVRLANLNFLQMSQAKKLVLTVEGVKDVETVSRVGGQVKLNDSLQTTAFSTVVGIENTSLVYKGWINKPEAVAANETYVWEKAAVANKIRVGETYQFLFTFSVSNQTSPLTVAWNLTVKGFAKLDEKAYAIASGSYYALYYMSYPEFGSDNLFIVDWHATMLKLVEVLYGAGSYRDYVSTALLVQVNRDTLIAPWDMETSLKNVRGLEYQIQNKLSLSAISSSIQNNLEWVLVYFSIKSIAIRMAFTFVSLPIFFMAWYMGTTVSDVSFNMRRREIGLLLTKGFSRNQIQWMFLTETLLLGLIGGALGVLFGFLLMPLFTKLGFEALLSPQLISPYTVAFTIIFGAVIAILSTYSSAKRASQLPTVEALREYLYVESVKPYKKRTPWIAFLLGTYKIIIYILGINMTTLITRTVFTGVNFFLILLAIPVLLIDGILNYIGPLLFFWGACKIFIEGSLKFQELVTKVAKSLGDLGALATKNVRRNPARSAAIAFLLALIVSYSVQVSGQLASEQDFNVRSTYVSVGADISVYVARPEEAENVFSAILGNISGIENATIEYSFSSSFPGGFRASLKAVQPQSWLKAAYYESEWFSGSSAEAAFAKLSENKSAIILERTFADYLDLKLGDQIALEGEGNLSRLFVVGFFGPSIEQQSSIISLSTSNAYFWSFVSKELYNDLSSTAKTSSYARILLKLERGTNGTGVAEAIRALGLKINSVDSFAEKWEEKQADVVTVGVLDAQRLGILFAILAASVGTALVSFVTMKERSREATLMSVRGMSYKQLVIMFLTENLALVTFAVILGVSVGFIVIYGNISASNSLQTSIIQRRIVYPFDATITTVS
ncbi:MAG: FtsX-like permease family protein, partial [Candidatus Bathyarchaeia archaeon]